MSKNAPSGLRRVRTATTKNVRRAASGIGQSAKLMRERAKAATEGAGETIGAAKLKADKAAMEATRVITEHPLAAVAAAAAIGALAANLLPRLTRRKNARDDD